jgi:ribose-phosphate pyrophosphokinase
MLSTHDLSASLNENVLDASHGALVKNRSKDDLQERVYATQMRKDTILFAYTSHAKLMKEILHIPKAQQFMVIGNCSFNRFEDEYPNLRFEDCHLLRGRNAVIFLDFYDHKNTFEQLAVLYCLPRYFCRSLTIILPYFPAGSNIRVDQEGQVTTAMTLAKLISITPLTQMGPAKLLIWDIHLLQERFYFGDRVVPILLKAAPLFINELKANYSNEPISIVFPDEGAYKRFGHDYKDFPFIVCSKVYHGEVRQTNITMGDVKGRYCFIVDDTVNTGRTLIECKNTLLEAGALAVGCCVTHAIFGQNSFENFEKEEESVRFKKFIVTNSCPTVCEKLANKTLFKILSLAELVFKYVDDHRI